MPAVSCPGITGLDLTFRQGAPLLFAALHPTSGVYGPTNFDIDPLPTSFPLAGAARSVWSEPGGLQRLLNPTGTWNLFALDDIGRCLGQIAGGWTLNITTAAKTT